MASDNEASCDGDPNFAVICGFLEKFGTACGLTNIDFLDLQEMLENTHEVAPTLIDLHIKLLRKLRKSVSTERWERAVINVCHSYNSQDAWEIERFGYKKARLGSKLRLLKQLLEMQFDLNVKFKNEINKMSATELRTQPLGRDKMGHAYWFQADECCQIRVYKEDSDEETWALVAKDRESLVALINELGCNEVISSDSVTNEDSNSLEIEKPILDTGQSDPSSDSTKTSKKSSDAEGDLEEEEETEASEENGDQETNITVPAAANGCSEQKLLQISSNNNKEESPIINDTMVREKQCDQVSTEECSKANESNNTTTQAKLPTETPKVIGSDTEKIVAPPNIISTKDVNTSDDDKIIPEPTVDVSSTKPVIPSTAIHANVETNKPLETESSINVTSKEEKPAILRLKPLTDLLSVHHESEKKVELSGIKEKYIRSDPPSQTSNRKAVDSAGFAEIYKAELKRPLDYSIEEPSILKRPRTDRPTLLGNKKIHKLYIPKEDETEVDYEECEDDVGEIIEEPLMLVTGKGSGNDNNSENISASPIIGEEIEEPIMYITGVGSGKECQAGNENEQEKAEEKKKVNSISNEDSSSATTKNICKTETSCEAKQEKKETIRCPPKKTKWELSKTSTIEEGKANVQKLVDQWENIKRSEEEKPHEMSPPVKKSNFFFGPGSGFTFKSPPVSPVKASFGSTSVIESDQSQIEGKHKKEIEHINSDDSLTPPLKDGNLKGDVNKNVISESINNTCPDKSITNSSSNKDLNNISNTSDIKIKNNSLTSAGTKIDGTNVHNISTKQNISLKKPPTESATKEISNEEIAKPKNGNVLSDIQTQKSEEGNNVTNETIPTNNQVEKNESSDTNKVPINSITNKEAGKNEAANSVAEENLIKDLKSKPTEVDKERLKSKSIDVDALEKNSISKALDATRETKDNNSNKEKNSTNETFPDIEADTSNIKERNILKQSVPVFQSNSESSNTDIKNSTKEISKTSAIEESIEKLENIESSNKLEAISTTNVNAHETIEKSEMTGDPASSENKVIESSDSKKDIKEDVENVSNIVKKKSGNVIPRRSLRSGTTPVSLELKPRTRRKKVAGKLQQSDVDKGPDLKANNTQDAIIDIQESDSPKSDNSTDKMHSNEPNRQKQCKNKYSDIDMNKLENEVIGNEEFSSKVCKDGKKFTVQNVVLEKSKSEETVVEEECKKIKVSDCYVKTEEVDRDNAEVDVLKSEDNVKKSDKIEIPEVKTEKKLTISTLSLDFTEPASPSEVQEVIKRVTRKRGRGSPTPEFNDDSKRRKRGRRPINKDLRRSVEEQKKKEISSSEEEKSGESDIKIKPKKHDSAEHGKDAVQIPKKKKRKKRTMLGLDIPDAKIQEDLATTGVRQSRRIAQIKIKEEAERRKLEEMTLHEIKETHKKRSKKEEDKDYKAEKRKRNKIITEDETTNDVESDEKKKKKKRKRRKSKNPKFDETNPWKSSSDSSSESHADEDEDEGEYEDDDDASSPLFKSDHEFSPESDIENDEAQPLKRARTVRKEDAIEEESIDDTNCQKCSKSDHPEWILLCDGCDSGWHCSCLRPALLNIPEGDWYCPPCQHIALVKSLQTQLVEFDKKLSKREIEVRRKERLAYVGISLDNVLPSKETDVLNKNKKRRTVQDSYDESASAESSLSGSTDSESSTSDSEDEPIYQLRQRRQAHSYRFNDYDELINSAIQDEVDAVQKSGAYVSKGKDITNIVAVEADNEANMPEELPPVVPANTDLPPVITTAAEGSDEEIIRPVKKLIGKKKHRKLNSLDVSSGDDDNSDEDFRGSSSDEDDDDFDDDLGSESSDSGNRRRRHKEPVRRSTRARVSRYDSDFINDDTDDDVPKRKKRTLWTESESEPESDRSWGRRKRQTKRKPQITSKRNRTKKKRSQNDSDPDVYKRRKPKIKFGGLESEEEGVNRKRRTRGKKINYIDALGSDSEDEVRRRKTVVEEESEDEFVLNEEEEYPDEAERDSDDSNDGPHMVGAVIKSGSKKGKGKGGIKRIKRAQGEENELFPPLDPHLPEDQLLPSAENDLETNPIEQINKNLEAMDEKEMEMMMEEEEYATKQLQMVAAQLEKEKRRKELEARRLEAAAPAVVPPPVQTSPLVPPLLPTTLDDKSPKKRGRKPKGTAVPEVQNISLPVYDAPHNIEKVDAIELGESNVKNLNSDGTPKKRKGREIPVSIDGAAKTSSPSEPSIVGGKLGIASAPQPFSQSQPKPATITRMLQTQPGQPPFPVGGINMKYYADRPEGPSPPISGGNPPNSQYIPVTGPGMNHFSPVRGSLPPAHRLRSPGPQNIPPHVYHSHHPMDPSPSGGGPISVPERSSPALVSPSSASPLSNKGDPTPPPPPYVRPPMMVPQHLQQSRPPNLPYHPGIPANFHYSPYPPSEEATPPEQFQNVPPYPEQYQPEGPPEKNYDEENGEFGGLVSYFSSQREDDLDT